jgi:hypothetical protein
VNVPPAGDEEAFRKTVAGPAAQAWGPLVDEAFDRDLVEVSAETKANMRPGAPVLAARQWVEALFAGDFRLAWDGLDPKLRARFRYIDNLRGLATQMPFLPDWGVSGKTRVLAVDVESVRFVEVPDAGDRQSILVSQPTLMTVYPVVVRRSTSGAWLVLQLGTEEL